MRTFVAITLFVLAGVSAIFGPLPSPPSLKTHAYTPEEVIAEAKREKREEQYAKASRAAAYFFHSYGCRADLADIVGRNAVDQGLSTRLLTAVIFVESTCRKEAVSSRDAVGPMQVNWHTWRQYNRRQLLDPKLNIAVGSAILAGYIHKYGLVEGLHCYNGLGNPTNEYAERVLGIAQIKIS